MKPKQILLLVSTLFVGWWLAIMLTACGETSTTEPMVEDGLPSSSSMGPPADLLNADTIVRYVIEVDTLGMRFSYDIATGNATYGVFSTSSDIFIEMFDEDGFLVFAVDNVGRNVANNIYGHEVTNKIGKPWIVKTARIFGFSKNNKGFTFKVTVKRTERIYNK